MLNRWLIIMPYYNLINAQTINLHFVHSSIITNYNKSLTIYYGAIDNDIQIKT